MSNLTKKQARQRRHMRLRHKISGTAQRPRMAVCRTDQHLYVQLIDDTAQHTLASVSTLDPEFRAEGKGLSVAQAAALGKAIAGKASAANITEVVFDRGGFAYHGRIKALADAARATGLKF